ncbi:hypothetical protein CK203_030123 [Vitis vinifera]|uniref:Uncharacterized protein n=1 Tax=Vitis vinifera TaxID=29760 RepID=A0A438I596_VITVI|nr:hypothetical protein CK203_030123 [Vitis vinifera]
MSPTSKEAWPNSLTIEPGIQDFKPTQPDGDAYRLVMQALILLKAALISKSVLNHVFKPNDLE